MTFCEMHKPAGCFECPNRKKCTKPENDAKDAVQVASLPKCDLCAEPAAYDAKLPMQGCWAYVCERHFKECHCSTGLGKGQKLILIPS